MISPRACISRACQVGEKIMLLSAVFALVPLILYRAHQYNKKEYGRK